MRTDIQAIILATSKTQSRKTNIKLTEKICGQEIILYLTSVLDNIAIPMTVVIDSFNKDIKNLLKKHYSLQFIDQVEELGTLSATNITRSLWHHPYILVMKADAPLITTALIENLYKKHVETNAAISFVAAHNSDPSHHTYSRVINQDNTIFIRKSAELCFEEIQEHCCLNGGIYLISRDFLIAHIDHVVKNHATQEFHLSDLVNLATTHGKTVSFVLAPFDQIRSASSYQELWAIEQIKRSELIRYWMEQGVRFSAAQTVHIDLDVEIGSGSFIGCSVHLLNGTRIGTNSIVNSFSIIEGAIIGDHVTVHPHSVVRYSTIGDHTQIGPFAHVQTETIIGNHCAIGNFVETKRTVIGNESKAKHLTYLGDTHIGNHVNIGAGTITCNYDGTSKHKTVIEDHVFIGSNNSLVAPVTIGTHSFTAAGSVITKDVPPQSLAIARARQVIKEGYTKKEADTDSVNHDQTTKQSLSFLGAIKFPNDSIADQ
jgi:bifunctional UDP-N-acetylglucosamine pyrophosphorylase/glucosamine-1-phosphate N-acetyltransferase